MAAKILETERLILRTWTLDDLDAAFRIWGNPEVMRFIDDGQPKTIEQVKHSIMAAIQHQEAHSCQHWAVLDKNNPSSPIGACGFNHAGPALELVFHFSKDTWGKGYATEAARACVDYAFKHLQASKLIAGAHPENIASQRVLQKLGFSNIGMKWFEDTQQYEPCFEMLSPALKSN